MRLFQHSIRCHLLILVALFFVPISWAGQPSQSKLTPQELQLRRQQAKNDPVKLLLLFPLASESSLKGLRNDVFESLKILDKNKMRTLAPRIVRALSLALNVQETVDGGKTQLSVVFKLKEMLGPHPKISRQILYRRYIECWLYDAPIPLCITIDFPRGKAPAILGIIPLSKKN